MFSIGSMYTRAVRIRKEREGMRKKEREREREGERKFTDVCQTIKPKRLPVKLVFF